MKSLLHCRPNQPGMSTGAPGFSDKMAGSRPIIPSLAPRFRAIPNHLARSSIYAPIARGRRILHQGTTLISRSDAIIRFSGQQLDQSHADVWMQLLYESTLFPVGRPFAINRATFLRAIGRHTGNCEYKWLMRSMEALAFGMLVIDVRTNRGDRKLSIGETRALHMIDSFDCDHSTGKYVVRLDDRWRHMFEGREYALIDWNKRMEFSAHQDMAKALQLLIATSNESPQRFPVERLKEQLGYDGRPRDFLRSLDKAIRELERVEIIAGGRIALNSRNMLQAVWNRL
ncbi:plasmid-related transcriptional repressor protein [Pandoraea apista]|uniref:plasmid-related transcriptional repressor protein n=1 Tax=Pandoraea apista TaxID=93218 RepID=UPI00248E66E1|nr:plasmid-related transcriptional repressor protein [Pandoraea apista]